MKFRRIDNEVHVCGDDGYIIFTVAVDGIGEFVAGLTNAPEEKTLGQIAYESYIEHLNRNGFEPWDMLGSIYQPAWEAAAQAVVNAVS